MTTLIALAALTLTQEKSIDRSGEPALRNLVQEWEKRPIFLSGNEYQTAREGEDEAREWWFDFWRQDPRTFRYHYSDNWSTEVTVVSDGKTCLSDPRDPFSDIILRNAPASPGDAEELGPRSQGSYLLLLVGSSKDFQKVCAPDQPLTMRTSGRLTWYSFQTPAGDSGTLLVRGEGASAVPVEMIVIASPTAPRTFGSVWRKRITVDRLDFGVKHDPAVFSTAIPAGIEFVDQRKPPGND